MKKKKLTYKIEPKPQTFITRLIRKIIKYVIKKGWAGELKIPSEFFESVSLKGLLNPGRKL